MFPGRSQDIRSKLTVPWFDDPAWRSSFKRRLARGPAKRLVQKEPLEAPSYCVVWIARVFSPNVSDFCFGRLLS